MVGKVFKTIFEIAAKYTGKPAIAAANRDLNKTERNAKQASIGIGKLFGALGAGALAATAAYKTYRAVVDIGGASFEAAKDVKKSHDLVRQSMARLVSEGRMQEKFLEKATQDTIALGTALEKAGGIDAEVAAVGLAGLSRSMDWKQVQRISSHWQDWMVRIHKGAPTMEQAQEASAKLAKFVEKGTLKSLEGLGITKEQMEGLKDLGSAQERSIALEKMMAKVQGDTAAWKKTDAGVEYDRKQAAEANLEIIGKPMADAMRNLNIATTELLKAMEPVSEQIAKYLTPALANLAQWMRDNKQTIVDFAKGAVNFLHARYEELIVSIKDTYTQGKWLWDHLIISFDDTKAQWLAIVEWLDKYIIKPVYNLFFWLWEKVSWLWEQIVPKLEASAPAVSAVGQGAAFQHRIPQATDFQGQGTTGSAGEGAATGEASNAGLAEARAQLIAETNDPAVRAKLYARAKSEVGNQGEEAIQKEMETIFNRAYLRGQTIAETVAQGGKAGNYWGGTPQAVGEDEAKMYDRALTGIRGGSNKANLATGNESDWLRNGQVVSTGKGGERFVIEPNDVSKHHRLRAAAAKQTKSTGEDTIPLTGGNKYYQYEREQRPSLRTNTQNLNRQNGTPASPTNVSMSPTINVQGVAAGSEDLVAQKVARVLRNNSKENIAQLKRDRNYEIRTGYV